VIGNQRNLSKGERMRSLLVLPLLLVLSIEMAWALEAAAQQPAGGNALKPLVTLYGQHSKITKPKELRITSEKEWQALWWEHQDDKQTMNLDFNRVMVVAVFQGDGGLCSGIEVDSIIEERDRLIVRARCVYFQLSPSPEFFKRPDAANIIGSQAWGIFVMPRSNKQILLQRDDQRMINSPPKWVKWTTFPAIAHLAGRD
jgi:hypothetical protein